MTRLAESSLTSTRRRWKRRFVLGWMPGQSHLPPSGTDSQDLQEVAVMPASTHALVLHAKLLVLGGALGGFQHVQRDMSHNGEILSGITRTDAAVVFTKCDIQCPVKLVLNAPMAARSAEGVLGGKIATRGNVLALFNRGLAIDGSLRLDEDEARQIPPLVALRHATHVGRCPTAPHFGAAVTLVVSLV